MSNENVSPLTMKRILQELHDIQKSPLDGITVSANEEDITQIDAFITGPEETPFQGGRFRMKLVFESDFPQAPPKGYFLTRIFHPNVSPTKGEICVDALKKDWKPSYGLRHILMVVRCLLIAPNPESALNEEAGRLLLENYDDYFRRARLMTSLHAMPREKEEKNQENIENVGKEREKLQKRKKKRSLKRL